MSNPFRYREAAWGKAEVPERRLQMNWNRIVATGSRYSASFRYAISFWFSSQQIAIRW